MHNKNFIGSDVPTFNYLFFSYLNILIKILISSLISGNTFETIDPRNGEIIARISEGDKEDINLAVKAAREAFDNGPWPRLAPSVKFISSF